MNSDEVIRMLKADGWLLKNSEGSHHHYIHPSKSGKVTVKHPAKDIPTGTLQSIRKQAGLK